MSVSGRGVLESFLGATLADLLRKPLRRVGKAALGLVLLPLAWLWSRLVILTGSVRGGTLLLVLLLVAVGVLVARSRGMWTARVLQRAQRRAVTTEHHGGGVPHALYRWDEPTTLPYGSVCRCGKPRYPGERIYVGESNDVVRRQTDDDRTAACWFVPGIIGTIELYETAALAKMAEKHAIETENPRENIAHAGRRRRAHL